jgi:excisionase family DNA binding protein
VSDRAGVREEYVLSFFDLFNPQLRAEFERLIEDRVEEVLRRRRPERRWVTVRECARQLGISERAVRGRIARGRIAASHHGRSVLVDMEALDRQLEDA